MAARRERRIDDRVRSAIEPLRVELRWQRWLIFALVAVSLSPKLGGPTPPQVADTIKGAIVADSR